MKYNFTIKRRRIAITMLVIMIANILTPYVSYALTSGPVQPETQGFKPASVSDMVDVQTGDLKYNIPLLDIDGYPINLNYQSGVGMDDEASWVGLGWSLTPGAINRQVRGIPDDFLGDTTEIDQYTKPKVTVGGRVTAKAEVFGLAAASGSFTFGVFSDNYFGIGGEFGVNAGISFSRTSDSYLTAGLGVGVLSNTQSGVDATPYVSLSVKEKSTNQMTTTAGLSASLGYNTRSGMKDLTLGASFGANKNASGKTGEEKDERLSVPELASGGSHISFNTPAISPSIQIPYHSTYNSYSFDIGGEIWGGFFSGGGTGYRSVRSVRTFQNIKPAYGFLYADRGKNNKDALMDFIREKDNPVIPQIPNIAIPIHTPDLWSYNSQTGSGQFRLYRGGSGAFFDNSAEDDSSVGTLGVDLGLGGYVHGGITLFNQTTTNVTNKWTQDNGYLANGDFQDVNYKDPNAQNVYFKQVGEKGLEDSQLAARLSNTDPLSVLTVGRTAFSGFKHGNGTVTPTLKISKNTRRANRTVISYLTAQEASKVGLDAQIKNYPANDSASFYLPINNRPKAIDSVGRTSGYRKPHHISELTVTDDGGKRMVYGIPVYNTKQDEYSFAVGKSYNIIPRSFNQVSTPPGIATPQNSDKLGLDHYYQKEHKAAYASSYLLTAILSPDYVDKTSNGISDDDLGTAVKFNYSKISHFNWRTPYQQATLNKCLLADPDDDKGSIVYGEKELWYISSIESKTKVAYFITQDRQDALGVANWQYGGRDLSQKQKMLKEIRLYSKSDMTRPIKVVKFQYDYELCRGVPNSADLGTTDMAKGGKLTLKRIWFQYGNTDKGKYHPYVFDYNKATTAFPGGVNYTNLSTDRWGVFKDYHENPTSLTTDTTFNDQYPYSDQNKPVIDENSALWHLKQIGLPTGGTINVNYESNDYAYVQDKKAMVMSGVDALITADGVPLPSSQLNKAKGLRLNVGTALSPPPGDQTKWFKDNFLDGSDYLYTKLYVKMSTGLAASYGRDNDYVPVYCKVGHVTIGDGKANVIFTDMHEAGLNMNPISLAAWQRLKSEYPRYAYPGFDSRVATENSSITAAIGAVVQAAKNVTELNENFYQKADRRSYASEVNLSKSFVKLTKTDGFKLGGGTRVKKISIADNWQVMTGSSTVPSGAYGQAYDYTTTEQNRAISSGVATYEPAIGNDENALKEPVLYEQNIQGGINNYFSLEKPFCESLYPAPSVGYSKVTVNDLGSNQQPSTNTGYIVNEFYTAKDFPVKVSVVPMIRDIYKPSSQFSLTSTNSEDDLTLSQGYCIELNDMHGKARSVKVLNQSGAEISSTVYYYKQNDKGELDNHVDVIDKDGLLLPNQVLGRDIEFFTDVREQVTTNKGQTVNVGVDVIPAFFGFPLPIPHFPGGDNNETKQFRSACALKVVQTYAMLDKVVKTQNGSSITTQNIAFDGLTGEPIVTKTQNEFNKDIYSVNMPAYWVYAGMGGAYQNLGVYLSNFTTNALGEVAPGYSSYLHAGDEVCDLDDSAHYWVINNGSVTGIGNTKKLIDRNGILKTNYNPLKTSTTTGLVKIVRSGFRNMLSASTSSIVCLNNPIITESGVKKLAIRNSADLTNTLKVINASANTFVEDWAVEKENTKYDQSGTGKKINTDRDYRYSRLQYPETPSSVFLNATSPPDVDTQIYSHYWGDHQSNSGRFIKAGIWPNDVNISDYNFGFDTLINFPESKIYYFGCGASNTRIIKFDCQRIFSLTPANYTDADWYVWPLYVTAGLHLINAEFYLKHYTEYGEGPTYFSDINKYAGLEIYNNTKTELLNADSIGTGINLLFSTKDFPGKADVYSFVGDDFHYTSDDGRLPYYYSYCHETSPPSVTFLPQIRNPYIFGYLGNWRPYLTKVFQRNRKYADQFSASNTALDISNAGYIDQFRSHWYYNTSASAWTFNTDTGTDRWVTANTVTLYDKYGQQLENKDALGRYSAANFDFNGELPSAVASNAMNREVYTNSIEDARFVPGRTAPDTANVREFVQPSTNVKIKALYDTTYAHSGNYSAKLPTDGVKLTTIVHTGEHKTTQYLDVDASKQYITKVDVGLYPNGFEPRSSQPYILNVWVRDANPYDKTINLALNVNSASVPLTCKAVIESWKLMEGTFTTGASGTQTIALVPNGGSTIYVDDIRIFPAASHVKTYAYDDKTMRLMAELDENAFATFYEYDDEGLLIRVKKETERGIMTIKESRSSYIKNTH